MVKLNFNYNVNNDAWSWIKIAKSKDLWGLDWEKEIAHIPQNLLDKILKSNYKRSEDIVKKYIKNNPKFKLKKNIIEIQIDALKQTWSIVEEKYFKALENIMQKPIYAKEFHCYFTSGFMCPYNEKENWFMVSMWHSIPFSITTICHELMHLQFLHYYRDFLIKKRLNKKQIENLKESLTFLLNEKEFNEIILVIDSGYPEHKKFRTNLKKIWQSNKNFSLFLEKAANLTKKYF